MARPNPRRPNRSFRSARRLKGLPKEVLKNTSNRKLVRSVSIFDKDETEAKVINCDYLLESDRFELMASIKLN